MCQPEGVSERHRERQRERQTRLKRIQWRFCWMRSPSQHSQREAKRTRCRRIGLPRCSTHTQRHTGRQRQRDRARQRGRERQGDRDTSTCPVRDRHLSIMAAMSRQKETKRQTETESWSSGARGCCKGCARMLSPPPSPSVCLCLILSLCVGAETGDGTDSPAPVSVPLSVPLSTSQTQLSQHSPDLFPEVLSLPLRPPPSLCLHKAAIAGGLRR